MDGIASKIYSSDLETFVSQEHWTRVFLFFFFSNFSIGNSSTLEKIIKTTREFESWSQEGKGSKGNRRAIQASV